MINFLQVAAIALATLALPVACLAHDYKIGPIEIGNPWSRATPASARAAAGYLVLTNKGTTADRLVSAGSSAADRVEIHEMRMDANVMRMRELARGITIEPGATVELKPGGLHIMLIELKTPLVKDQMVPVTLVFEKAGRIQVEFQVEALGAPAPADGHKH